MMKKSLMALAGLAMLTIGAATSIASAQALTDGQVTKVDASAGKITIKHGPMPKFDMDDGMTMVYRAQDPAMLTAVKAGDKIKFDAEHINGQFVVTKIQKAK
jgi:Cu(I)/Ag(I) efflux system protein CusF